MHVLTKIFIVLVSLLALLLVPLVVVYSHNEDSFKAKYQVAEVQAAAANRMLQSERASHGAELARKDLEIQDLNSGGSRLASDREAALAEVRSLQSELAQAGSQQAKIRADLAKLASAVAAGQELMESLLGEVTTIRSEALAAEKRSVQLDERVRELDGQLEVAVAARRALQEELQQLRGELATAIQEAARFIQVFGPLRGSEGEVAASAMIDVDLRAHVVNVRRAKDQTLVEIDAGSRDGVKEGWKLMIARGGQFLGNLLIIEVDINRATGIVELEDPENRGRVEAGDRVYGHAGRS